MPDRAVVDDHKLNPLCRCKGCDGSCEEYENLTIDRWEEPMSADKKRAEYGVPGDGFNIYATPEGHVMLELSNNETTRIVMTAGFAEQMANDLMTALVRMEPREDDPPQHPDYTNPERDFANA